MLIGPKTLETATQMLEALILRHQDGIKAAYAKAEGGLTISMSVKLSPNEAGTIDVETGISFTYEKVRDTTKTIVDEKQGRLIE